VVRGELGADDQPAAGGARTRIAYALRRPALAARLGGQLREVGGDRSVLGRVAGRDATEVQDSSPRTLVVMARDWTPRRANVRWVADVGNHPTVGRPGGQAMQWVIDARSS
jgi:hypothetical protein